jgi:IstB-like ATP binding protein
LRFCGRVSRRATLPAQRIHQAPQLADPLNIQRDRRPGATLLAEHVRGDRPDRPRRPIRQTHDQMEHPIEPGETAGPQPPPEQRVRLRGDADLARQHRTQMVQSVAITPGTGKTHLAIGLAIRACQAGHRVLFATAAEWVARLAEAHHASRLQAELVRLGRYPLLVVDEVGYIPFEAEAANLFFQLVSSRYERASLIVTSNKPFGRWGEVFGDDVVAAAMIDRLVHHAEVVALKGDSYRLKDRDLGRVPTGRQPDE